MGTTTPAAGWRTGLAIVAPSRFSDARDTTMRVMGVLMLPAIEHDYIGAVGGRHQAVVDEYGSVRPDRYGWWLDWWIGADDRWHGRRPDGPRRATAEFRWS